MYKVKPTYIIVLAILLTLNFSCNKEKENGDIDLVTYREIAWNSLSESAKGDVTHNWTEASVNLIPNPDNTTEQVVMVYFHTTYEALTCGISVYIDPDTKSVIYPKNIPLCM